MIGVAIGVPSTVVDSSRSATSTNTRYQMASRWYARSLRFSARSDSDPER